MQICPGDSRRVKREKEGKGSEKSSAERDGNKLLNNSVDMTDSFAIFAIVKSRRVRASQPGVATRRNLSREKTVYELGINPDDTQ